MIDNNYSKALCELNYILENTDINLVKKIPTSFMSWINKNKSLNYETNIQNDIPISDQILLPETEALISLIFRKYWCTNEEKNLFVQKDKQEYLALEKEKVKLYNTDIFKNKSVCVPTSTQI